MEYTAESHINSIADVEAFARHIYIEESMLQQHPDDGFENQIYDRLNNECFEICDREGKDYYGICYELGYAELKRLRNK